MGWGSIPLTIACPMLLLSFCAVLVGLQYGVRKCYIEQAQTKEDIMEQPSKPKFERMKALTLSLYKTLGAVGAGVMSGFLIIWIDPSG
jgi:hypothetical protein